jgi:hypothetical protein
MLEDIAPKRSKVKSNVPEHNRLGQNSPRQILKQTAYLLRPALWTLLETA